jgi:hypothetical protein
MSAQIDKFQPEIIISDSKIEGGKEIQASHSAARYAGRDTRGEAWLS